MPLVLVIDPTGVITYARPGWSESERFIVDFFNEVDDYLGDNK